MSQAPGPGFDIMAAAVPQNARSVSPYSYTPTAPTTTAHGSSVAGQPGVRPPSSYYADYNPQYPQAPSSSGGGDYMPNPYAPGYHPGAGAAAGVIGGAALGRGPTSASTNSSAGYPPSSGGYPQSSAGYPPSSTGHPPSSYSGGSPRAVPATLMPGGSSPAPTPVPTPLHLVNNNNNTNAPRSAKEREAFQRANPESSGPVHVHQDGGRIQEEEEDKQEAEIPPTYDSIPQDRR